MASGCQGPDELGNVVVKKGDSNSEALTDLLETGWTWVIFSAAVEVQWKELPGFIQMALNSTNGNNKQLSEIECAAQLAQCVIQGQSLSIALEQLKACDTQCKKSLEAIGIYVSKFGGGDKMGLVMFSLQAEYLSLHTAHCWDVFWVVYDANCSHFKLHPQEFFGIGIESCFGHKQVRQDFCHCDDWRGNDESTGLLRPEG